MEFFSCRRRRVNTMSKNFSHHFCSIFNKLSVGHPKVRASPDPAGESFADVVLLGTAGHPTQKRFPLPGNATSQGRSSV